MSHAELVIEAARAVVDGTERACSVAVTNGRVVGIDVPGQRADRVVRFGDDVVLLPGLVDTHVHVNEPGRTEWEGFEHATRAAAAGGVTTIVDMPLNSIPATLHLDSLETKRRAAATTCHVDVGFWGGAVPTNGDHLGALWDAGVFGFKCFLADSGVPEFPALDAQGLEDAMRRVEALGGLLLVHAEDPEGLSPCPPTATRYADFLGSRPEDAEVAAVAMVVATARRTGCRSHVVHVSAAAALPLLAEARAEGVPVSAETCPHYLTLSAEEVPEGGTAFKCCPPIRGAANRELLWEGLSRDAFACVVSDHSPSPPAMKALDSGDFAEAWGGISSLQLALPAVWTEARRRGHDPADLAAWMAEGPARLAGLGRKGRIRVGADADFCVLDPDAAFVVDPDRLAHRSPVTPYAGRKLVGVVRETWLAGRPVEITGPPRGRLLRRGDA